MFVATCWNVSVQSPIPASLVPLRLRTLRPVRSLQWSICKLAESLPDTWWSPILLPRLPLQAMQLERGSGYLPFLFLIIPNNPNTHTHTSWSVKQSPASGCQLSTARTFVQKTVEKNMKPLVSPCVAMTTRWQ